MLKAIFSLLLASIIPSWSLSRQLQDAGAPYNIKDSCALPNGMGLHNLYHQVEELVPKDKLMGVIKNYVNDPEIIELRKLLQSDDYQKLYDKMKSTKEYQALKEFVCDNLHIDLNYYGHLWKFYTRMVKKRSFLPDASSSELEQHDDYVKGHKGVEGFIMDVYNILPHKEIKKLYEELMVTDEELRKAVQVLKSSKFYGLVKNLRNTPIYQELRQQWINVGVPLDKFYFLISNALEWPEELYFVF